MSLTSSVINIPFKRIIKYFFYWLLVVLGILTFLMVVFGAYLLGFKQTQQKRIQEEVFPTPTSEIQTGQECVKKETGEKMSLATAQKIARESECVATGDLTGDSFCNQTTGTWWLDLNLKKEGCAPACVVDMVSKKAEINWRCTGLIKPEIPEIQTSRPCGCGD